MHILGGESAVVLLDEDSEALELPHPLHRRARAFRELTFRQAHRPSVLPLATGRRCCWRHPETAGGARPFAVASSSGAGTLADGKNGRSLSARPRWLTPSGAELMTAARKGKAFRSRLWTAHVMVSFGSDDLVSPMPCAGWLRTPTAWTRSVTAAPRRLN
jgi:hypothetical protein